MGIPQWKRPARIRAMRNVTEARKFAAMYDWCKEMAKQYHIALGVGMCAKTYTIDASGKERVIRKGGMTILKARKNLGE